MIGKLTTGGGYGGTVAYVLGPGEHGKEDRATVLWHTMGSDNPEHWAIEMEEHARALNPDLVESGYSDLVIHAALSAAPGERLSKDQWIALASEYMREMGWDKHDHIIVQHDDRPHDHIHLIINRVGQDGQTADLHNDYQRQAAALEKIEKEFGLDPSHAKMREAAEADPSKAVDSLTHSRLTFTEQDAERYFKRLGFDDEKAHELTTRALAADNVLATEDGRYTTSEVQKEVFELNERLATLAGRTHGPLPGLAGAADPDRELSADQKQAREAIAEGKDLTVVVGIAGAGKTAVVKQVHADHEANGYDVIGAAPTGKAARGLQASAGIESSTIASLLLSLEHGSKRFDAHTVLVIDEAGMARLDDISKLAAALSQAGGRMVMLGDDKQLQAVGHGGALTLAEKHAGSTILDTVWRQKEEWMKEATRSFGHGDAPAALQAYANHGDVRWSASVGSAVQNMILDYGAAVDNGWRPDQMLAMAYRNDHVAALNSGIRDELQERGHLQDVRTYDLTRGGGEGDIEIAVGDRIVLTKNPPKSLGILEEDVKNGMFGTVLAIRAEDNQVDIQLDKGSLVRLDLDEFAYIDYGYAATIHKSQGASIEKTFELATNRMDSHLTYVAMSRHESETTLYANSADFRSLGELIAKLSKSHVEEKFDQILTASIEKKLETLYALNPRQVEAYLAANPEAAQRVAELGITPGRDSSYLDNVLGVLREHIGKSETPTLGSSSLPGLDSFRDALQEWSASLDGWKHDPMLPMNPTEQVIHAVLDGAVSAVWNALAEGTRQGLTEGPKDVIADLARVTWEHSVRAAEQGLDGMAEIGKPRENNEPQQQKETQGADQTHGKDTAATSDKGKEAALEKQPPQGQGKGSEPEQGQPLSQGKGSEHSQGQDAAIGKGGSAPSGKGLGPTESDQSAGKGNSPFQDQRQGQQKDDAHGRPPSLREGSEHNSSHGKGSAQSRGQERPSQENGSVQAQGQRPSEDKGLRKGSEQRQEQGMSKDASREKQPPRSTDDTKGRDAISDKGKAQGAGKGKDQSQRTGRESGKPNQGNTRDPKGADRSKGGSQPQGKDRAPGRSADKSKDSGKAPGQTKTPGKSPAPSKGSAKSSDKGKTAVAQDKAAQKTQDSGKDRGYGRERYR